MLYTINIGNISVIFFFFLKKSEKKNCSEQHRVSGLCGLDIMIGIDASLPGLSTKLTLNFNLRLLILTFHSNVHTLQVVEHVC